MAADEVKQTSEQQMRTLQFNDKVSRLNREFIRQLQEWYKQCAHYDFSNSVRSYLEHMKRLDEMYSGKPSIKSTGPETPTTSTSGRVIAKAKRRLESGAKDAELNDSVKVSTPSGAPPRFSLGGDVSVIKPNLDITLTAPSPKVSESTGTSGNVNAGGGRKRAIRGGGPAGGSETVVFRGSDSNTVSSAAAPLPTTNLPKPTPGFWSSQKKDNDSNDSASSKPTFSFGSTKADSSSKEQDKNFLTVPPVSFGNGKPLSFGVNKDDKPASSFGSFGSSKKDDEEPADKKKPTLTFPTFGAKKDEESSEKKSTLTFPTFGAKKDDDGEKKSTLTFPPFGAAKENEKDGEKKPTLTFPSFGSTTNTDTSTSGGLKFSFGALPKSSTEGAEEKGDEEGEYVPPKAEVVETEEAGATFSSKCSVFKLVDKQYTKMGVGMLHLKEIDGKKSVLVRAATAIGTVWVNALMNKTMKVAKADEKGEKLRLTCPASEKEISTYVIRFPSVKEATKVREEIEEASK
ncbi:hypothetical protein ANCCAN_06107 [Ancylostoma caninum]|uniref:RanBD1 domain-containing protein n=1 Tax=Ancylostoma caninum TaxID=29170 RepID=A0A368GXN6_ANCCA|nr:hypothetical protein ANCCAN_06107 [Ancylostoma caninum]